MLHVAMSPTEVALAQWKLGMVGLAVMLNVAMAPTQVAGAVTLLDLDLHLGFVLGLDLVGHLLTPG